ncbi:Flagellar basal-body rod modification protein FlgD [hydrothermal vent metagenome]|uniref:Flagellar basal-body rod modification protein FlgD n=1 Tax=hydrothermal vent metagenome TaxID=652676 RepID=A0A3B1DC02_9ZZZZ
MSAIGSAIDTQFVQRDETGFSALKSEDFLKLLITQLQNQDPSEPTSNEDLLNQISAMRSLQSNLDLGDTLQSITANQQLSTAATFIGKTVTGLDANNASVTGLVTRAFVRDDKTFVEVDNNAELEISSVSSVNLTAGS